MHRFPMLYEIGTYSRHTPAMCGKNKCPEKVYRNLLKIPPADSDTQNESIAHIPGPWELPEESVLPF